MLYTCKLITSLHPSTTCFSELALSILSICCHCICTLIRLRNSNSNALSFEIIIYYFAELLLMQPIN